MKRTVLAGFVTAVAVDLWASFGPLAPSAEPYAREYIWPEGKMPDVQAHQIAAKTAEKKAPGFKPDDFRRPYIEWYAPNPATQRVDLCVLFISGGGFYSCCDAERMQPAIDRFVQAGVTVASLTYRTPRPVGLPIYQSGWEDAQRAVRVIRSQAAKRGFSPDKIGATGISAGSKLLLLLATSSETRAYEPVDEIDELPCNLLFAIPQAPAYVLTDGMTGPNTRQGDAIDVKLVPEFKFDAKTCPMCLFQGGIDEYSPSGSTQLYRQLRRMRIPAELHLFAGCWHGFHGDLNKGEDGAANDHWFFRALEFVRQMNYDGRLGEEVALTDRFVSDDDRASYEKQAIWPEGKMPDVQTNQCVPYLEWHLPKDRKTSAIQIVYSGGSYMGNNPDGFEVAPVRRYLNAKGMTVVTMKYRTPRPLPESGLAKHTTAWQDLQRAIRIVRSQAKARGLDPDRIGIMGSSAGGHLTLMGATSSRRWAYRPIDELDQVPCNVQWAVAIYPAYALTDGIDKGNAQGGNEDDARPVREFSFDHDTCPMLFLHGDADGWAAMNSVKCWEQLRRMGVQCDLHTLATRSHCFQRKAAPGTGSYTWLDRIWEFLNGQGVSPSAAPSVAADITVSADRAMRLYPLNSNAVVTVSVRKDGRLVRAGRVNVRVTNDGGPEELARSTHDLQAANPFVLEVGMRKPGFAFVEATLEGTKTVARANLGFEIERIAASRPEPADFDAWWAAQFAEQAKLANPVSLKPVSDPGWDARFNYFQLQVRTIAAEGQTTGFLGIPKKAKGKLPCFVIVQCAGPGYCAPEANFIREDMMTLTLNVHPWDTAAAGYRDFYKKDDKENGAYMYRGCESREKSYFRNAVLGCKTAVDYVLDRDDCTGELFYFGSSQGGGMGLILGGIYGSRITAMCIQVPALCDLFGSEVGRQSGWPRFGGKSREMDYYDAVNWARRVRSPLHFRVGMMDRTCPPSGPMAAYNAVPRSVPKFLSIGTDWVHGCDWAGTHLGYGFLQNFMDPAFREPYRAYWP